MHPLVAKMPGADEVYRFSQPLPENACTPDPTVLRKRTAILRWGYFRAARHLRPAAGARATSARGRDPDRHARSRLHCEAEE